MQYTSVCDPSLPTVGSTGYLSFTPLWCDALSASYPWGTGGSFRGVKRLGRETDLSPPPNAEVKNAWIYTSAPLIRLYGGVLS